MNDHPQPKQPPQEVSWYERNWRWFVLGTLFFATFLNYLDRQTLSVAMDPISEDLGLDSVQRGNLLAAFVYAYAASHLFIGFILDRIRNLRWFFPAMLLGWSVATMLIGFSQEHTTILSLRYVLGVFEAVNFPISFLLIARIFPPSQRAFATGVFTSGAILATLIAPKMVIFFAETYNWRWAFFVNGGLGLTWLIPWLIIFRHPERRAKYWPRYSAETGKSLDPAGSALKDVLGRPAFWAVAAIGVGIIPGLYFMTQWLPSYFTMEWDIPYDQALGNRLVLIYIMQDTGSILGGVLVWVLMNRGLSVLAARKTVIAFAFICTMSVLLLPTVESVNGVVTLTSVYIFGLAMWIANHGAFKQEVNRKRVATVAALVGFAETGFAAFVVDKVGEFAKATGGFGAVFGLLGGFLTLAFLIAMFLLRAKWMDTEEREAGKGAA